MTRQRTTLESQTWGNVPPYPAVTLTRPRCSCGWGGLWSYYRENAASDGRRHACRSVTP